ncbi:MAG: hypothetical protein Q4Q23_04295 [Methanobacteriaceae archaeon]|nr:hypothetical protein [Methanobacteriaceae archaeon]
MNMEKLNRINTWKNNNETNIFKVSTACGAGDSITSTACGSGDSITGTVCGAGE